MKAEKVKITIVVEGLSKDILRGQLGEVVIQILDKENQEGELFSEDGDYVGWNTTKIPVEF